MQQQSQFDSCSDSADSAVKHFISASSPNLQHQLNSITLDTRYKTKKQDTKLKSELLLI